MCPRPSHWQRGTMTLYRVPVCNCEWKALAVRRTLIATGMTVRECMAASSCGRVSETACGLAVRRMSPSSSP